MKVFGEKLYSQYKDIARENTEMYVDEETLKTNVVHETDLSLFELVLREVLLKFLLLLLVL